MSNYKRVKAEVTSFRLKTCGTHVDIYYPILEKKYKLSTKLITCVYNPNEISLDEAWRYVHEDIAELNKIFREMKGTVFALISVEVHSGGKPKTKKQQEKEKEKKRQDKEELDEAFKGNPSHQNELSTNPPTLKDYPHVHVALALNSYDGTMISDEEISAMILENTHFDDDVKTDSSRKAPKQITSTTTDSEGNKTVKKSRGRQQREYHKGGIITYVLKNCKHELPYVKLGNKDNCILYNYNGGKDIIDFFDIMRKKKCCIINIINNDVSEEDEEPASAPVSVIKPRLTAKTNMKQRTRAKLLSIMKEEKLRIYDGHDQIYQRVPGSKHSWIYWGPFSKLVTTATNLGDEFLDEHSDYKKHHREMAIERGQTVWPTLTINWNWIEYSDFYLHIPSAQVFKCNIPNDIDTVFHVPGMSFEEVSKKGPNIWLDIIKKQSWSKDPKCLEDFFTRFYLVLMPLKHKKQVLCLLGPTNAGKTSIISPFTSLYPREFITELTKNAGFQNQDIEGKRLLLTDDSVKEIYKNNNFLQLTEGGKNKNVKIEEKHKGGARSVPLALNTVMVWNSVPEPFLKDRTTPGYRQNRDYEEEDIMDFVREDPVRRIIDKKCYGQMFVPEMKPEFKSRIRIFPIDGAQVDIDDVASDVIEIIANEEYGKVFLFCARFYAQNIMGRKDGVITRESWEEGAPTVYSSERTTGTSCD